MVVNALNCDIIGWLLRVEAPQVVNEWWQPYSCTGPTKKSCAMAECCSDAVGDCTACMVRLQPIVSAGKA